MGGSTLSATTPAATEAKHITFLKLQDVGSSPKAPVCMHFLIMACSLFTHAGKKNRNVVVSMLFQLNVRHKDATVS